jgi:hypothetical protein
VLEAVTKVSLSHLMGMVAVLTICHCKLRAMRLRQDESRRDETSSGGSGVVMVRWQGAAGLYMLSSGNDATCGADTTNQTTRCSPLVRAHAPNMAEACKQRKEASTCLQPHSITSTSGRISCEGIIHHVVPRLPNLHNLPRDIT